MIAAEGEPWRDAGPSGIVDDGQLVGLTLDGRPVALCRVGGEVHAFADQCPHLGASLSAGALAGTYVECPAHYALFDVTTGRGTGGMACANLVIYPAREDAGRILVRLG